MRLVQPLPALLAERVLWHGVSAVPPGRQLTLQADGRLRSRRWHRPPEPRVPLAQGAAAVRSALTDAVAARTRLGGLISGDLSGGMDSTSICSLAARDGTAKLIACTAPATSPRTTTDFTPGSPSRKCRALNTSFCRRTSSAFLQRDTR
ncbi:asparagine synthase-related protein [Streptomyces sp. INA 01156]